MSWGWLGYSLLGPPGTAGASGAAGPPGPQGPQGPAGPGGIWGAITGTLGDQSDLQQVLAQKLDASKLTVGPTAPSNPALHDLWIDTN